MEKVKLFGFLNVNVDHDQHIYYDVPRINEKLKCGSVKEYPEGFDFKAEQHRRDWQYRDVPIIEDKGIGMPRYVDHGYFTYVEPSPMEAWELQNQWTLIILGILIFITSLFLTPIIYFGAIYVCLAYFIIWVVWSFLKMYEWDHPYAFINMKTIKKKKDE